MGEIIDIRPIIEEQAKRARTCENCAWWKPPELSKDLPHIFKDSRCTVPGGWTARFIGTGPYGKVECNDFKRKTEG